MEWQKKPRYLTYSRLFSKFRRLLYLCMARVFGRKRRWFRGKGFFLFLAFLVAAGAAVYVFPQGWNSSVAFVQAQPFAKNWHLPTLPANPFRLGLDLQGGTHLVYQADLSKITGISPADAMASVRDVIERRVNLFGVSEPQVQVSKVGDSWRLIVDLAGINNVNDAINQIGQTPYLDFRQERPADQTKKILDAQKQGDKQALQEDPYFEPTALNGSYLQKATLDFDPNTYEPIVTLTFNAKGAKIFEDLTKANLRKRIAIYLDGSLISAPVVQNVISGGHAQISGNFTIKEAKTLVERLNAGALPVPIKLISQNTVGASLGRVSLQASIKAGLWGAFAVAIFMILYYRLPGLVAVFALLFYVAYTLAIFKIFAVTMTLAGIAGVSLSVGMAVDANVLIFERIKEELRSGSPLELAIEYGVKRAWNSIRDANLTTIISAAILYTFTSSFVKGFALTLMIGVLVSMFTAIVVSRLLLLEVAKTPLGRVKWLFKALL